MRTQKSSQSKLLAILIGGRGHEVLHRSMRNSRGNMSLKELMSRIPDPSGYLCRTRGCYANTLAALSEKDKCAKWKAFLNKTLAVKDARRMVAQHVDLKQLYKQLEEAPGYGPMPCAHMKQL